MVFVFILSDIDKINREANLFNLLQVLKIIYELFFNIISLILQPSL